jgi:hypothetical protein
LQDQRNHFPRAWYWLAQDVSRNPVEAQNIMNAVPTEVNIVQAALDKGTGSLDCLPQDVNAQIQIYTFSRPDERPGYFGLLEMDLGHFVQDTHTAYTACNSVAVQVKPSGDLMPTYAMNVFGDHFLQDSFAAGHIWTPRRKLHDALGAASLCAEVTLLNLH